MQLRKKAWFLLRILSTSNFWLLFLVTLIGALMMAWRCSIRDDIFKFAQKTVGKRGW